ncbi:MAG: hypothetical protein WC819_01660 [Parcubacteria group bacterium]|jgi:hypothetical protein
MSQDGDDKIINEELDRLESEGKDVDDLRKFLLDKDRGNSLVDPELEKYGCFD